MSQSLKFDSFQLRVLIMRFKMMREFLVRVKIRFGLLRGLFECIGGSDTVLGAADHASRLPVLSFLQYGRREQDYEQCYLFNVPTPT